MKKNGNNVYARYGFSLIDVILSLGIIVALFGGIYLVYFSILDVTNNADLRSAATAALNRQIEIVRNLPYNQVGTINGVPSGVIPQNQTTTVNGVEFSIGTVVRNIDDPFDGTLDGNPNDTAPADYKLLELTVSCPKCARFAPFTMTTTVAPKNLEVTTNRGSLFINVFDAYGSSTPAISVHVVNTSTTPTIDLTDTTNANGVLQLVDVPTSTQSYQITVSASGYSSERTYPMGASGNPNPVKPNATVAQGQVTDISFAVDRVSSLNVVTKNAMCVPLGNRSFSIAGAKLIGMAPDVLKFSTSSQTNTSGTKAFNNLEWDTYSLALLSADDLLGTIPLAPLAINPSSTIDFAFVLQNAAPNSLLVTIKDSVSDAGVANPSITLSKGGFSKTLIGGHGFLSHTDWSSGQYTTQDGGIDPEAIPGILTLLLGPLGTYPTSTTSWLISNTFDVGSSTSAFYSISWTPTAQPGPTGSDSLKFQVASNNDGTTWNYIGPDGTGSTYYTTNGQTLSSDHNNHRYFRYKVYLHTDDENYTPRLDDITFEFSGVCVPPSQVLFNNLSALGSYSLSVTAAGYQDVTSTVPVSGAWQQTEILMNQ